MYPFQTTGHPHLTFTKLGTSVCFIPDLEHVIWNMRLTSPRGQRPEHGEGLLSRGASRDAHMLSTRGCVLQTPVTASLDEVKL